MVGSQAVSSPDTVLDKIQAQAVLSWPARLRCLVCGPRSATEQQACAVLGVRPLLVRWLHWWHGHGEPTQHAYYRCHGCQRVITWQAIRKGGCTCGLGHKLSPARLSWWLKLRLIVLPFWCVR